MTWRREVNGEDACVGGNRQRYEMILKAYGGLSEGQDVCQKGQVMVGEWCGSARGP